MTSKERVQAAMKNQEPDRVPVMCQLSWGHILLNTGIRPSDFFFNPEYFAEGFLQMREKYNFDGILLNQHCNRSEEFRKSLKVEVQQDGEMCTEPNGDRIFCPYDDDPRFYPLSEKVMPDIDDIDISSKSLSGLCAEVVMWNELQGDLWRDWQYVDGWSIQAL